ncbi:hypothetical protein ACP0AK_02145 [Listeria ivanovii]|uniref:Uncharacterized protein n=1 Tax=Listeria ivanovii (strain ATCC BAA-678 / PAM 55) TaxID=881621 RepID=G2ZFM7_LISIP|nr:hypothetical protein [Listeria ivanovii]AHI55808.1 hypothetical protein AX25_06795 [Listeria ivanovii WSLC3009]AIS65252.1 hypothetical protein JL52_06670 [Listeria ivanovii subsp. ivanovii]MBC1760088.1 hypothetical protein [Listeria ivanovii]MBK3914595.1 hypothetical protein [Listeria ivanovii subsp. ivanovii]MBK3921507.1 hypothetical protein [Listeria ivanovii subsp. ivanovii]
MVKWNKIHTYSEQIEQWDNQSIIEMPMNSEYQGYFFLLPKKMVFSISAKFSYFYFPNTWKFQLKKHTEKKVIDAEEMMLAFDKENKEISQSFHTKKVNDTIIKVRTHIPKKLEKDVIINNDLIR